MTAEEKLRAHSDEFRREVISLPGNIYVAVGFGIANSILLEGATGSVLVDTMEGTANASAVRAAFGEVSNKPLKAIIYTHSHQDHVGGASVFIDGQDIDIISRKPFGGLMGPPAVGAALRKRAGRQFGWNLPRDERLNEGIGPGDRDLTGLGAGFVAPTYQFSEEELKLTVAGVELELVAAPGETDDQLFVWLPQHKTILCADNYYKAFPNLYAIRGTPYRDIGLWVSSLNKMIAKEADCLVPGHTRPIIGKDVVRETLTAYRDAISFVLQETLAGINKGMTPDELVEIVVLPPHLAQHPSLQEFYGMVQWTVRAIFTGYLGWFDGNPTNLFPLNISEEAQQLARLVGGIAELEREAQSALDNRNYRWAMRLADCLEVLGNNTNARIIKSRACRALAMEQISANGRNYLFSCAQELEREY